MKILKLLETYTKRNTELQRYLKTTFSDDISPEMLEDREFIDTFFETLIDTKEYSDFVIAILELDPYLRNRSKLIKGIETRDSSVMLKFFRYLLSGSGMSFEGVDASLTSVKMRPFYLSSIPKWWDKIPENFQYRVFQILAKVKDPGNPNYYSHTKIMMHSDSQRLLPRSTWLIHFTPDALSIAMQGFNKGISNTDRLGITVAEPERDKKNGGYNFAFNLSSLNHDDMVQAAQIYGTSAVMFMNSGVTAKHHTDEQSEQVIFWGKDVDRENIVPIAKLDNKNDGGDWAVYHNETGKIIFSGPVDKVALWVKRNFSQYKNVICPSAK